MVVGAAQSSFQFHPLTSHRWVLSLSDLICKK